MKKITLLLAIITLTSCSVRRNVTIKELASENTFITTENDTLISRQRMFNLLKVGDTYTFYIIKGKAIDGIPNKSNFKK